MKRLALFDLDNTLLAGDSDYEWGQFLVDRGVLEREAYEAQNRAFYEQYKAGTLDIHEFLGFALRPLADHTPEDLARWHRDFMRTRIEPMMLPAARALVRRLDEWLAGLGRRFADFGESACYRDSHNDLPLLERVSRPVAVDPDETLAREAARRGWERISLR